MPSICHRPTVDGDVFWRYTFLVEKEVRDRLLEELRSRNIPASCWFPPVHILFDDLADINQFPGARDFSERVINVWVGNEVTLDDIDKTSKVIVDYIKRDKSDHIHNST